MRFKVYVDTSTPYQPLAEIMVSAGERALIHAAVVPGDVTVVLTDEASMRELHQRYAGEDVATDVLSFPDGSLDPDTGRMYFGDVVIAVPLAEKQARAAHHPLSRELALLAIHGILHLLGYDHATKGGKAEMWRLQDTILNGLEPDLSASGSSA